MVYGVAFPSNVIFAPAMIMIGVFTALGVGIWLAALNVAYRDVRYVVPFVIQLWLFVTPVIYPASFVTDKLNDYGIPAWVYGLNPVAGAVHGLRWAVLGEVPGPWRMVLVSGLVSLIILFFGDVFFRRFERTMADVV